MISAYPQQSWYNLFMTSSPRLRRLVFLTKLIVVAAIYVAAAKLGLLFAIVQANATAVWAPTGIAIAAIFIFGYELWPAIFVGAFFANIMTPGTALLAALGIAVGNTLEAVVAVYLVRRYTKDTRPFERVKFVFVFSLLAGIVAPFVSATIGVTVLALTGSLAWANYFPAWITWWLGDLGGALIIAPALIIWFQWYPIRWHIWVKKTFPGSLFLGVIFIVASYFVLRNDWIFIYLAFPLFVWMAFAFGQRVIATGVVALTEVLTVGTLHGLGPFIIQSHGSLNGALLLLDGAMASTAVTMLAFAAMVEENKQSHEILRRQKLADEVALASVNDALVVTNQRGEVIFLNPQAEALLGMPRETLLGKDFITAVVMQTEDGTTIKREDRPLFRALETGGKITNNPLVRPEYYVRPDGGRVLVSYMASPVAMDDSIIGAIEFFRDASKDRAPGKAKTDLIALASHQLRTPLSIIGLSSELLQGSGTLFWDHGKYEVDSYARDIQVATKQMMDIVNDLLSMSQVESQSLIVKMEPVDMEAMAETIVASLKPKIMMKRLNISVNVAKEARSFWTDRSLLTIIMQNLISNAVKYAHDDGAVTVSVAMEEGHAVIVVSDTGYGIPESEQEKIFDKFFRASNVVYAGHEGTGLGLYITKAMIEELKGTISFVSEEGRGATFIVRLPPGNAPSGNGANNGSQ